MRRLRTACAAWGRRELRLFERGGPLAAPLARRARMSLRPAGSSSVAELHFGVQVAADPDERARRVQRLGAIESTFDPAAGDSGGRARVGTARRRGGGTSGRPRRRAMDLVIAATANVARVSLVSENVGDFEIIRDLVDIRPPERLRGN